MQNEQFESCGVTLAFLRITLITTKSMRNIAPFFVDEARSKLLAILIGTAILCGTLSWLHLSLYKAYFIGYAVAAMIMLIVWVSGNASLRGVLQSFTPILVLLAYACISILWTPELETFLEAMPALACMPLVFFVGFSLGANCKIEHIETFFEIFNLASLLSAAYVLYFFQTISTDEIGSFRTIVANSLVISLPFVANKAVQMRSKIAILIVSLNIIAALFLGSRILLIAGPLIVIATVIRSSKSQNIKIKRIVLALGIIAGGLLAFNLGEQYLGIESSISRFSSEEFSVDLAGAEEDLRSPTDQRVDYARRLMSNLAIYEFLNSPIHGIGFMGMQSAMESRYGLSITGHGVLGFVAELGAIGSALFIAAMVIFFRRLSGLQEPRFVPFRWSMLAVMFVGLFHQFMEVPYLYLIYGIGTGFAFQVSPKKIARTEWRVLMKRA